jgi:Tol biopolymer transport system component
VLALALGVLTPVALIGLNSSTSVQAAPTPIDPGPATPAQQRLAFSSAHHSALVGRDLDAGTQEALFGGSGFFEVDRDASGSGGALAFTGLRPDGSGTERDGDIWYAAEPFTEDADPVALTRDGNVDRHPSLSPDGGRVAFASTRDGNTDIWVVDVDGSNLVRVTDDPAEDDWPSWAPDSERLVFRSTRADPDGDLYIARAAGTPQARRLTDSPGADGEPAWAPSGNRIAFTTTRWDARGHLAIVAANTGRVRQVGDGSWHGSQPAWSPGGDELAYTTFDADSGGDVFTVALGGDERPVAASAVPRAAETDPTWSTRADRYLVFTGAVRDSCECTLTDIWRVNADGTGIVDLTNRPPLAELSPAYSPDGRRLAYLREREGAAAQIVIADADGGSPVPLGGPEPDFGTAISWSPDGGMLTYVHETATEQRRIVIVRVSDGAEVGGVPTQTGVQVRDLDPAWSPDGDEIAFSREVQEPDEFSPSLTARFDRIFVVSVTGDAAGLSVGIPRQISDGEQEEEHDQPAWAPDGERLAYRQRTGDFERIHVVARANPDQPRVLVDPGVNEFVGNPAWSPDGSLIAFSARLEETEQAAVYAIPSGGAPGDEFVVFDDVGSDDEPDWQPFADLRVHAEIDPDDIPVGSTSTATFTVVNDGPTAARGTDLEVTVPDGLTLEAIEPSRGSCDLAARTCALGTIAVGEPAAVQLVVRGDAEGLYELSALATTDVIDISAGDNGASVNLRVGRGPDLSVTVEARPVPAYVGGAPVVVTYTIENSGEFPAPTSVLTLDVPPGLPVSGGEASGGAVGGGAPAAASCAPRRPCALGTIGPGPDNAVTVKITIRPTIAVNGLATGSVTTTGPEVDRADNADDAAIVVIRPVLELDPPIGPPGFVTDAVGRDFPPGALVRLTWDPGLTTETRPVRVGRDGTLREQVLVVRKDELGVRVLRAEPVQGPRFSVEAPEFLVVAGAAQPRDFVDRD